jgi:hypothetical protein
MLKSVGGECSVGQKERMKYLQNVMGAVPLELYAHDIIQCFVMISTDILMVMVFFSLISSLMLVQGSVVVIVATYITKKLFVVKKFKTSVNLI